jgi:hypothetical protein
VSATVSGGPPASPPPGFAALLQPAGSSFSQDQVKLIAEPLAAGRLGQDPDLSYELAVCGSQPSGEPRRAFRLHIACAQS